MKSLLTIGAVIVGLVLFFKYYTIVKRTTAISTTQATVQAGTLSASTVQAIISDIQKNMAAQTAQNTTTSTATT